MAAIQVLATPRLSIRAVQQIRSLLNDAFGGEFSADDWRHALGGWHAMVMTDGGVVSHAAVVPRAMEVGGWSLKAGYVEAVATAPSARRCGHGSRA